MKTVTSLSGGKSSAMMAVEFPTDHYVFAVVLTDQLEAVPKDPGLLRECKTRIPSFKASRELDLTLSNMLDLEQLIGQKIDWVCAPFTFDELIYQATTQPRFRSGKIMLPNARTRFCTEQLKLYPIFWHCFLKYWDGNPLFMNIGFRWDEPQRVEAWSCDKEKLRYPFACSLSGRKQWQYNSIEWRISQFPLYDNRLTKDDVRFYWERKGWKFPSISNCDFCFHHRAVQQQVQAQLYPERAKWWIEMENRAIAEGGDRSVQEILDQKLLEGVFESKSSCHCSD